MKKKIISAILAVCMLVTVFAGSMIVMADDASTYDVSVTVEGTVVTVTVTLPGEVNAAAGNFTLQYDSEKVVFSETVSIATSSSLAVTVNPDYSENSVRASWSQPTPITQDTVLWVMEFEYIGGTLTAEDFAITAYRIYDENSQMISGDTTASVVIDFACNHAETESEVIVEPTHTEMGTRANVCAVCGETISTESIATVDHSYGEWEETVAPTCTEAGEEIRTCECGATETREVAATGHTLTEWVVITEPTCTEEGEQEAVCEICGESVSEVIAATGHTAGEWEIITEATCTESGERKTTCTVCGVEYTEEIPATGHEYGEWTVVTEATETEEGLQVRACAVCGSTETEAIPVLAAESEEDAEDGTTTASAESETATSSTTSPNTGASYAGLASAIGAAALSGAALLFIKKRKE